MPFESVQRTQSVLLTTAARLCSPGVLPSPTSGAGAPNVLTCSFHIPWWLAIAAFASPCSDGVPGGRGAVCGACAGPLRRFRAPYLCLRVQNAEFTSSYHGQNAAACHYCVVVPPAPTTADRCVRVGLAAACASRCGAGTMQQAHVRGECCRHTSGPLTCASAASLHKCASTALPVHTRADRPAQSAALADGDLDVAALALGWGRGRGRLRHTRWHGDRHWDRHGCGHLQASRGTKIGAPGRAVPQCCTRTCTPRKACPAGRTPLTGTGTY
jgi:hypothetical protein